MHSSDTAPVCLVLSGRRQIRAQGFAHARIHYHYTDGMLPNNACVTRPWKMLDVCFCALLGSPFGVVSVQILSAILEVMDFHATWTKLLY
jgi:hypothetical protein